ncbi:Kelch repeat-containing protein [Halococcus saccharolyticus]|uniref:Kelch repeat-containing protein n=1 Tax=Halococcus saccharolyticus DSM 5350 TaxID=1227455 RepID=M0MNF8_9EURY|nr:hypothetical protein [Halococcus saccharolyticus]EMA46279.1 Kelch repeat-containing protein [Halococcus saccharolyticus DSM 5350]
MTEDHRSTDRDGTARRTLLQAIGLGASAAAAGCLFGGSGEDGNGSSGNTSDGNASNSNATTEPARGTDTANGTGTRSGNERTRTQEQSIITTANPTTVPPTTAAGNASNRSATGSPNATRTTTSSETTTATPTRTTTRTETPTATPTETATRTPTETATATETPTETATAPASSVGWTERTPLPVVGSDAGGGVLDGELYFFGGIETATGLAATRRTFAYDPAAGSGGTWDRQSDFPRALWGPCGVATDDALYSFGGAPTNGPYEGGPPPSDAIFRYRPDEGWTDLTATQGTRCPYPNWVMGGVYNPVDGLIYCVGGGTGAHDAETATDHGFDGDVPGTFDERRLWTFDPTSESVADPDLARMPEAKRWPTVALLEADGRQYVHVIGGLSGTTGPTDSNFRYDVASGSFERATPMPRAGTYATHGDPVIGNRAYLTNGMFWEGEPTIDRYETVAHRYDPASDSFVTDLPRPSHRRGGATSGVIDGTLYVVGGHIKRFDQNGLHDCVAYNEAFTPGE